MEMQERDSEDSATGVRPAADMAGGEPKKEDIRSEGRLIKHCDWCGGADVHHDGYRVVNAVRYDGHFFDSRACEEEFDKAHEAIGRGLDEQASMVDPTRVVRLYRRFKREDDTVVNRLGHHKVVGIGPCKVLPLFFMDGEKITYTEGYLMDLDRQGWKGERVPAEHVEKDYTGAEINRQRSALTGRHHEWMQVMRLDPKSGREVPVMEHLATCERCRRSRLQVVAANAPIPEGYKFPVIKAAVDHAGPMDFKGAIERKLQGMRDAASTVETFDEEYRAWRRRINAKKKVRGKR
jgi:hypothetical protein